MKKSSRGFSLIIILLFIFALGVISFLIYQNTQLKKSVADTKETPPPSPTTSPLTTAIPSTAPTLKPGWQTYNNTQYGFEIAHPVSYKELTSKEDLYGWEDAILLLYKGGQSYDLAVEVWNKESDYKEKYVDLSNVTVFKLANGKFITLLNANKDSEVAEIVSTFKLTN